MNLVTALAVVIGLLGGVATYLVIGPAAGLGLQIWAIFIAWASFFHSGGNEDALVKSLVGSIWGAVCATAGIFLLTKLGVTPVTAAIAVAVSVFVGRVIGYAISVGRRLWLCLDRRVHADGQPYRRPDLGRPWHQSAADRRCLLRRRRHLRLRLRQGCRRAGEVRDRSDPHRLPARRPGGGFAF